MRTTYNKTVSRCGTARPKGSRQIIIIIIIMTIAIIMTTMPILMMMIIIMIIIIITIKVIIMLIIIMIILMIMTMTMIILLYRQAINRVQLIQDTNQSQDLVKSIMKLERAIKAGCTLTSRAMS